MADLTQQISEAKQHGYSDDQIVGYLGSSHPDLAPKIKEAQSHGYGATDIIGHLASTPAESKSVGGFLSNVGSSAGRFVGDIVGAVTHPGRTLEGVTGLLEGMAEKSGFKPVAGVPHEKNVDALFDMYKDRYGSIENFKNALYKDPVGVLADVATLAGGVGAAGKGVELAADAAKLTKVADVGGTIARTADKVSSVTDPLRLAGRAADATGVTGLVNKGADAAKVGLMKSALRGGYNVNADAEDIAAAARTMADRGIPLSDKGAAMITQQLNDLQQQKIARLKGSGNAIDPQSVQLRLDQVRNQYGMQVNPDADLRQIDKVADTFSRNNPGPIPISDAEMLKEGTYAANAQKYKKGAVPPQIAATAASEQALARGLMEEIGSAIPEVGALNAKQAELLNLKPIFERAVNKYVNGGEFLGNLKREMFSKTGLEIGGATGILTNNPEYGVAAAALNAVLSDPAVKSRLAIAIREAQLANPGKYGVPSMATALSRVNEYASKLQQ